MGGRHRDPGSASDPHSDDFISYDSLLRRDYTRHPARTPRSGVCPLSPRLVPCVTSRLACPGCAPLWRPDGVRSRVDGGGGEEGLLFLRKSSTLMEDRVAGPD